MASDRYVLHISFKRLLVGLLLTVIPISLAGLFSLSRSDRALERAIGEHFKTIADSTASEVAHHIHERVKAAGALALTPTIADAVRQGNRSWAGMSPQGISDKMDATEKIWNAPAGEAMVSQILGNPGSRMLRRFREMDPQFLRITVTDVRGAVVAASHKTLDYFQADEEFWQAIYASGRGAISITDILSDEVTHSNYIGIGVPVVEEGTGQFIGALDALVDVSSVAPIIERVKLGPTSRVQLVKDDGTIITAPGVTLSMNLKSEEYAAIQDAMRTAEGQQTGYVVSVLPSGRSSVLAFADTGLKRDYRNLGWLILVCQETLEAFAPVRFTNRLLSFMALIGLIAVTILTVVFALHRRPAYTDFAALAKPTSAKPAEESEVSSE